MSDGRDGASAASLAGTSFEYLVPRQSLLRSTAALQVRERDEDTRLVEAQPDVEVRLAVGVVSFGVLKGRWRWTSHRQPIRRRCFRLHAAEERRLQAARGTDEHVATD